MQTQVYPLQRVLDKLDGVRKVGEGRWYGQCPAHKDKRASLSIRELDDGRVLLHDFAGCDVHSIVTALGLELHDLFPEKDAEAKRERQPFYASDALRLIDHEVQVAARLILVAEKGELNAAQRQRLAEAAGCISNARQACGLSEVRS